MRIESLYKRAPGRLSVVIMQKTGMFRLASAFLRSGLSRPMIKPYIRNNAIDMSVYGNMDYVSFSDFFARKKDDLYYDDDPRALISPCDGLFSVYPVSEDMSVPIKGSHYRLQDILPDEAAASGFCGGLCLVFRLRASDYHHFCAFDDGKMRNTHFIPGLLHSVQPIACEKLPVYRLNRRWWTLLDTAHFGTAAQIEIGAMMVGGVSLPEDGSLLFRGEEMGNFELAGSTIIILLSEAVSSVLEFEEKFVPALRAKTEIPLHLGEKLAVIPSDFCGQ